MTKLFFVLSEFQRLVEFHSYFFYFTQQSLWLDYETAWLELWFQQVMIREDDPEKTAVPPGEILANGLRVCPSTEALASSVM